MDGASIASWWWRRWDEMSDNGVTPFINIPLEARVIGALLIYGSSAYDMIKGILSPQDFAMPQHGWIFEAMDTLNEIDYMSVYGRLCQMGKDVREMYLLDLTTSQYVPMPDLTEHARILKTYSVRRQLYQQSQAVMEALRNPEIDPYEQVVVIQKGLEALASPVIPQSFTGVMQKYVQEKEALFLGTAKEQSISWGIPAWDNAIGKIYPTQFVVVAGSAGAGKSLFLAHAIRNWLQQGVRVGLVSLEMSNFEVLDRLTEIISGHNPENVIYSQDKTNWDKMVKTWGELYKKPLHLSDQILELEQLSTLYHQWKHEAKAPIQVLCVDYAGLVMVKGSQKQAMFERLTQISRYLKQFAMTYGVVVVSAVQLNRDGYNTSAPTLRELGGTISFAQDPNIVLGVWRASQDDPNVLHLKVLKNRSRYAGRVVEMRQAGLRLQILSKFEG